MARRAKWICTREISGRKSFGEKENENNISDGGKEFFERKSKKKEEKPKEKEADKEPEKPRVEEEKKAEKPKSLSSLDKKEQVKSSQESIAVPKLKLKLK